MDLGSPENGFDELNDLLKDDDSSLVGELGRSFIANKEDNALSYGFDNLTSNNEFCVDVNEQGQHAPPSLPTDFCYYDFPGSPEKFQSSLETGFDASALCETNSQEILKSPSKNFYQQEGTEEICCSYFSAFPSEVESETLQHEIEVEVLGHLVESPLKQAATQEIEMKDNPASPPNEAMVQETFLDMTTYKPVNKEVKEEILEHPTEILHASLRLREDESETDNDHFYHLSISPVESRQCEKPFSPRRSPQVSQSPERDKQMSITINLSPGSAKAASQKSLWSHGQSQHSSTKKSDTVERVDYSLPSGRKDSASPFRSRQSKQPTDDSSSKHSTISPRNHHLHNDHRRRDRSRSKSPVRRKESYSRLKAKHHDRSRSRSPYRRDRHRRSLRWRHSPRCKSPPSGYHSRHRSPRKRPWSPPPNRNTGLGKPGRILFVAGFSFLTTERDLDRKFSTFGRVRDVRIVRDKRSGDSRGFGFITLERDEEADAAIRALDKTEWHGRIVLVEKSKSH